MLPEGPVLVQEGKDLRGVELLIGTGGALINGDAAHDILGGALDDRDPFALVPAGAARTIDTEYLLYAVGLLAEQHPETAAALAESTLVPAGRLVH
jgi:hypothetical protein